MRPSWPPPSTATTSPAIPTCLAHRSCRVRMGPRGDGRELARAGRGARAGGVGSHARPRGRGPGAAVVVATGLVALDEVGDTLDRLAPTLAFLAAVFVLAEVARDAGLFRAAGAWMSERGHTSRQLVIAVSAVAVAGHRAHEPRCHRGALHAGGGGAGRGSAAHAPTRPCSRPPSWRTRRRASCRCRTSPTSSCSRPPASASAASPSAWRCPRLLRPRSSSVPRCGATVAPTLARRARPTNRSRSTGSRGSWWARSRR